MKKYMIIMSVILIASIFGCADSDSQEKSFLSTSMREMLDIDKDNELQVVYLPKAQVMDQIEILNKACDGAIEEQGYYKLRKRVTNENTSEIYYIDPETNDVICKLRAMIKPVGNEIVYSDEDISLDGKTEQDNLTGEIDLDKAKRLMLEYLKVEDIKLSSKNTNNLQDVASTGDEIEFNVKLYPRDFFDEVEARVTISHKNGSVCDSIIVSFGDIDANKSILREDYLNIPESSEEEYVIGLQVYDDEGLIIDKQYNVEIEVKSSNVRIYDVNPDPEETIDAGQALGIEVRLKNSGNSDAEDITLTASIDELGISDEISIDEIEKDSSQEYQLFFRIPSDADEKRYRVDILVVNEFGHEIDEDDFRIEVK